MKKALSTCFLVFIVSSLVFLPVNSFAEIWDISSGYSAEFNPNGEWSYGKKLTPGGTGFDIFTTQWGESGWYMGNAGHGGPSIQNYPVQLWAKDNSNGLPAIRWTCPQSDDYWVSCSFYGRDSRGVDVNVFVAINGSVVYSHYDLQFEKGSIYSRQDAISLQAGDVIDFVIEWDGDIDPEASWTKVAPLIHNNPIHTNTFIDFIQEYDPISGEPNSPMMGEFVSISGVVTLPSGVHNLGTHYLQDVTGGMTFYLPGVHYPIGSILEIIGLVSTYAGEIQITNFSKISQVGSTTPPSPLPMTPEAVMSSYENVGRLVSVTGYVSNVTTNSFFLHSGQPGDLLVYIDWDTGIDISGIQVGDNYRVIAPVINYNGLIELKPRFQSDLIFNPATSAVETNAAMTGFELLGAVPNPFNPSTAIKFTLADVSAVSLRIFDVSGHLVNVLLDNVSMSAGANEAVWHGRDNRGFEVSAGVYFFRLEVGDLSETRRMVLVK